MVIPDRHGAPAPAEEPGPRGHGRATRAPAPEPKLRGPAPSPPARRPRPAPAPVPGSTGDRPDAGPSRTATEAEVRAVLATVPDPEIPAVSLIDLGIVRDVRPEGGGWVVVVTPTYSGCPATAVIELMVAEALRAAGIDGRVERVLSPPWTTAWITPEGRARLEAYGIAPPDPRGPQRCPRCGGGHLEQVSRFGSTPCKAQWRCLDCREPFDHFKCH